MKKGKFNVILDAMWGSSGKGKISTWLADVHDVKHVSSANFPNAGHTARFEDGTKFVAKAMPTAGILKKARGKDMNCWISPASGFSWAQLAKEWEESGHPNLFIHERASIVTDDHVRREREGSESTIHVASTMQGSATAMVDKILRKPGCRLAWQDHEEMVKAFGDANVVSIKSEAFRQAVWKYIAHGETWLHEGSQGYALSIDHGSHYPHCTSRNCTLQAAMDTMAIPPSMVGDVYLNLRTFPIRVGNVVGEDGSQVGYSGDFYPDCKEMTWGQVAAESGMPPEEASALQERERTTVTKRIRRVCTFSFKGMADAIAANGATKLVMNFIQYVDWNDHGLRGGREAFYKLSGKSRAFIDQVEQAAGIPVELIGTGPLHEDLIVVRG